ncbi:short chain dehydrogenase, partial [Arthrobacter sp. Hiyo6]
ARGGPELVTFGHAHDKHPLALASTVLEHPVLAGDAVTSLALSTGSASLERIASGTAIDAGGLVPDLATINSWTQVVDEVDPLEMLEVQLCNVTAPFLLVSRLRGAMRRSTHDANTSSTSVPWRDSSPAPTRARDTPIRTWPRQH